MMMVKRTFIFVKKRLDKLIALDIIASATISPPFRSWRIASDLALSVMAHVQRDIDFD